MFEGLKDRMKFWLDVPQQTYQQTAKTDVRPKNSGRNYRTVQQEAGGGKWNHGLSNSGASLQISHYETRQNGRAAFHQSTQARSLIRRRTDITVDVGLKLEPTPAWDVLGITDDKFKERWVAEHEQRYDLYMKSKKCHRAETMTGYQLQRLCSLFRNRDNDQFIRYYYSKSKDLISPVQIDFIDPNQIRGYSYTDTTGFQHWQDGIKRDSAGKETHYKVWIQVQTDKTYELKEVTIPARGAKSNRVFMSHMFETEYAGQGRGYSPLHFAVQDLENITDFSSAELKKAINQSSFVGFVEPGEEVGASNPFEDLTTLPGSGPLTQGDETPSATVTDSGYDFACREMPEFANMVPGSAFITNLDKQEKIKFLENTSPGPQFDNFINSIMSYLSSAYSLPIEVVLMKFNANYSASRAALLMAWQTGRIEQAEIDADLMNDWWEMWLSEEIAAGRSQAPGWSDTRLKQAWLSHRLQGAPLPSISPRDDLAAIGDKMEFGLTTQEREARIINGSSAKQNAVINAKQFPLTPTVPWKDKPDDGTEIQPKPGEGSSDND